MVTQVYKIGGVLPHRSDQLFLKYFDVLSPKLPSVLVIYVTFWLCGGSNFQKTIENGENWEKIIWN